MLPTIEEDLGGKRNLTITLLGKRQAKEGHSFIFLGPISECRECQLKNICFNLDKGRHYRVIKVRDKEHRCNLFSEGVKVVEVERIPFHVGIPSTMSIEGSVITFHPQGCGKVGCEHWNLTHPPGLEENTRIKVLRVIRDVACQGGARFKEALVDFAD